jgi:hypothetical protein
LQRYLPTTEFSITQKLALPQPGLAPLPMMAGIGTIRCNRPCRQRTSPVGRNAHRRRRSLLPSAPPAFAQASQTGKNPVRAAGGRRYCLGLEPPHRSKRNRRPPHPTH